MDKSSLAIIFSFIGLIDAHIATLQNESETREVIAAITRQNGRNPLGEQQSAIIV